VSFCPSAVVTGTSLYYSYFTQSSIELANIPPRNCPPFLRGIFLPPAPAGQSRHISLIRRSPKRNAAFSAATILIPTTQHTVFCCIPRHVSIGFSMEAPWNSSADKTGYPNRHDRTRETKRPASALVSPPRPLFPPTNLPAEAPHSPPAAETSMKRFPVFRDGWPRERTESRYYPPSLPGRIVLVR